MLKITTSLTGHREFNNSQNLIQLTPKRRIGCLLSEKVIAFFFEIHARMHGAYAHTYAHNRTLAHSSITLMDCTELNYGQNLIQLMPNRSLEI